MNPLAFLRAGFRVATAFKAEARLTLPINTWKGCGGYKWLFTREMGSDERGRH